jgi:flagellar biogenesis protein FliO
LKTFFLLAQATEKLSGLKEDPVQNFSHAGAPVSWQSILQLLVALAIVIAIVRWVVPKYAGKAARRFTTKSNELSVIEAANLSTGQILLVRVHHKLLLIGATSQEFSLLADLTENDLSVSLHDASISGFSLEGSLPKDPSVVRASFRELVSRLQRLEK